MLSGASHPQNGLEKPQKVVFGGGWSSSSPVHWTTPANLIIKLCSYHKEQIPFQEKKKKRGLKSLGQREFALGLQNYQNG